jgi:Enoyl-CoA hydratase/carnithine racemase
MAQAKPLAAYSSYKYFNVTSPSPYVAHVEINRPEKLNAFHEAMWLEMKRVFDQLSVDPEVRAIVLSGAGERAFSAGLDVVAASEGSILNNKDGLDGARTATKLRRHIAEFQDSISAIEKCEKRMSIHASKVSTYTEHG